MLPEGIEAENILEEYLGSRNISYSKAIIEDKHIYYNFGAESRAENVMANCSEDDFMVKSGEVP
jgi:hypothetical protein